MPPPWAWTARGKTATSRLAEPVQYRRAPPTLGEHTEEVLTGLLGLEPSEIASLKARGAI